MSKHARPIITICASLDFSKHMVALAKELKSMGYGTIMPETTVEMEKRGDYEVSHYKTWFANPNDFPKKAAKIRTHFKEIDRGDAILVVNDTKRGIDNYIGANTLLEMGLAFWFEKPIFILNGVPEDMPYTEEVKGMLPVVLNGDLSQLSQHLKPAG